MKIIRENRKVRLRGRLSGGGKEKGRKGERLSGRRKV